MAIDASQHDLAEGDQAKSNVTAAASVLKDACVLVRRRNSRLRFSSVFVVRNDVHML